MPFGCRTGVCMGSALDGMTSFSARLICGRNLTELWAAVNYTRPQAALGSI